MIVWLVVTQDAATDKWYLARGENTELEAEEAKARLDSAQPGRTRRIVPIEFSPTDPSLTPTKERTLREIALDIEARVGGTPAYTDYSCVGSALAIGICVGAAFYGIAEWLGWL